MTTVHSTIDLFKFLKSRLLRDQNSTNKISNPNSSNRFNPVTEMLSMF